MENNFDKEIKKRLENLEVNDTPSNWDFMEEQIEANSALNPELEDVMLDGVVYERLHNFEAPFEPEHWSLMREKLDASYALRRKLMKYKVAEVALVVLFIFTLVQFFPIKQSSSLPIVSIESSHNNTLSTSTLDEMNNFTQQDVLPIISEQSKQTKNEVTTAKRQVVTPPIATTVPTTDNTVTNLGIERQKEKTIIPSLTETNSASSITINNEEHNNAKSLLEEHDVALDIALMEQVDLKVEDTPLLVAGIEELNSGQIFSNLKKPINIRIGMTLGADANYVMTPYHEIRNNNKTYSLETTNIFHAGYSGGLNLGFQYGNWEIETGALYSAVTYEPRDLTEVRGSIVDGFYDSRYARARIDMIRVPLHLKYNVYTKKKWKVYVHSGTALNMAAKTFFKKTTTEKGFSSNFNSGLQDGRSIPTEEEPTNYDGIFEGGKFSDNTFLTADFGFGVERYFTPRMSIFVQPNFRYHFSNGIGPQSDRINAVSFLTGAKVTLKKRRKGLKK